MEMVSFGTTLVAGTISLGTSGNDRGILSVLFNILATFKIAFPVVSPAFRTGPMLSNGNVNNYIMSLVACRRKSLVVTFGYGITVGKNVAVLTLRSACVFEK